jgi:hypothetical protein
MDLKNSRRHTKRCTFEYLIHEIVIPLVAIEGEGSDR